MDLGEIISSVVATVISAGVLAGLAWVIGPLKWFLHNRRLRQLVSNNRRFRFTFNAVTKQSKYLTFLPSGEIGEGKNENEFAWVIRRGRLEILAADGAVYSRFTHDKGSGQLKHTNDTDLRSLPGQYLEPSLVRVTRNAEQILPADRPQAGGR